MHTHTHTRSGEYILGYYFLHLRYILRIKFILDIFGKIKEKYYLVLKK